MSATPTPRRPADWASPSARSRAGWPRRTSTSARNWHTWWRNRMQCDDALLAALEPDPPSDAMWHTRSCPRCRAAWVDVRRGRDALGVAVSPLPGLEEKVVDAVTHARLEDEI